MNQLNWQKKHMLLSQFLTWCVMTLRCAICSDGSSELITGLTHIISTNSHKPSIRACSVNCSDGSFSELLFDNYTLDFNSTVMVREGNQEGTAKGDIPKCLDCQEHHPFLAFVSDVRMIANYWLRPGNTAVSTNYLAFLEDTLSRLENKKVGLVHMDSDFFTKEILDYLEYKDMALYCSLPIQQLHQVLPYS